MLVNGIENLFIKHKNWLILGVVLLVAILTNLIFNNLERFDVVKLQLLSDPSFSEWQSHWQLKGKSIVRVSDSQLDLVNKFGISGRLDQVVKLDAPGFVKLTVEAGLNNISLDYHSWAGGAVAFVYYDANGNKIRQRAHVKIIENSVINKYEIIERIDEDVSELGVSIRLLRAGGTFSIRKPVLTLLVETPLYEGVKVGVAAIWTLLVFYALYIGSNLLGFTRILLFSGLTGVTLIFFLAPPQIIATVKLYLRLAVDWILRSLSQTTDESDFLLSIESWDNSEFGHFLLFFVLSFILLCFIRRQHIVFGLCCLLVFAFVTEVLQLFVDGRSTNTVDLFIDIFGIAAGASLGVVVLLVLRRFRRRV